MKFSQKTDIIKEQYKNSNNLNKRISIHEKYSTNKLGFGNWIVSKYEILPNYRVLELGCGTGDMWVNHLDILENGSNLVLTDFSEGMLESAREKLKNNENIDFKIVDIQNIPFDDESFDIVIANMMIHHVPNLNKSLSEVLRVLKPGGKFYSATFGKHGIAEYIENTFKKFDITGTQNNVFTLQNGAYKLSNFFKNIKKFNYEDSLKIIDLDEFIEYIYSLPSITNIDNIEYNAIKEILESKKENNILNVPKEYGLFICTK